MFGVILKKIKQCSGKENPPPKDLTGKEDTATTAATSVRCQTNDENGAIADNSVLHVVNQNNGFTERSQENSSQLAIASPQTMEEQSVDEENPGLFFTQQEFSPAISSDASEHLPQSPKSSMEAQPLTKLSPDSDITQGIAACNVSQENLTVPNSNTHSDVRQREFHTEAHTPLVRNREKQTTKTPPLPAERRNLTFGSGQTPKSMGSPFLFQCKGPPIPSFETAQDSDDETDASSKDNGFFYTQGDAYEDSEDGSTTDGDNFRYGDDDDDEDEDDDDDDASVEKDSSLQQSTLFSKEARDERIQRNKERAIAMGLMIPAIQTQNQSQPETDEMSPDEPPTPEKIKSLCQPARGMVFATPYNNSTTIHGTHQQWGSKSLLQDEEIDEESVLVELEERYPHRHAQIRQLWNLISLALPPVSDHSSPQELTILKRRSKVIPPPIFVTGQAGTGKTSIVRDVVDGAKRLNLPNTFSRLGTAYINCATLDTFAGNVMDEILHDAYKQLAQDMKSGRGLNGIRRKRKRKRTKEPKIESFLTRLSRASNPRVKKHKSEGFQNANGSGNASSAQQDHENQITQEDKENVTERGYDREQTKRGDDGAPQLRRSRRVHLLAETVAESLFQGSSDGSKPTTLSSEMKSEAVASRSTPSKDGDLTSQYSTASMTVHVAADSFGQEVKDSLFCNESDCAFLILDQAEQLLSQSSSSASSDRTNFLAQLLLLPRMKTLNLTVIVVTKSVILDHSRFNSLVIPEKSLATLSSAIQPVKVHFPAYKGMHVFKDILMKPMVLERVVGKKMANSCLSENSFSLQVVQSFFNTLVQAHYGSTRDLKEIIRLGRSLWPTFVEPLHSGKIEQTMKRVTKLMPSSEAFEATTATCGKYIASILHQQFLPRLRQKEVEWIYSLIDVSAPSQLGDGVHQTQPYLSKCLSLAAFICQTNRADKDRQLFTIQKNGKRSGGSSKKSPDEDVAFGGKGNNGGPKIYRPRMFPMERMLSVFVSIVGLNEGQREKKSLHGLAGDIAIQPGSIGSSDLFEAISHLRDIGVLHEKSTPSNVTSDFANLNAPRFWCSLTREEADGMARSIDFPLESYLF